jgi:organic hydroperoxide reductase OsmC/OhrA
MSGIKQKSKQFVYRTKILWREARRGMLSSLSKPDIEVATPPEFRGHAGIWTPEDLFVAAVNSCVMTTFLYYADKEAVEFLRYESEAEGILETVGKHLAFSRITVRPTITVGMHTHREKIEALMRLSEEACLISNSIKSQVEVNAEVIVRE